MDAGYDDLGWGRGKGVDVEKSVVFEARIFAAADFDRDG
jgi:hypothetical protein